MPFKTILVHCDADKKLAHRLGVAAELAESNDACLVGLYVRPPFQPPVVFDSGFTVAMNDFYRMYEENTDADQAKASAAFAQAIKAKKHRSEWRQADGPIDSEFALQARYADLAVVGQYDPDSILATPPDLPQYTALGSGRPVLVIPYVGIQKPPGRNVMLCWNESRESARAATDALPILAKAASVTVLIVESGPAVVESSRRSADKIEAWLARHGITSTIQLISGGASDVGGLILSRAADHGSDLIVMGLYGHSRTREFVLGGTSRTLLASMTVPVFMVH
jgi:nucleotide-binding universal stress UspA family protein